MSKETKFTPADEMYEALEKMVSLVMYLEDNGAKIYDEEKEWIESAKQALSKARGENNNQPTG